MCIASYVQMQCSMTFLTTCEINAKRRAPSPPMLPHLSPMQNRRAPFTGALIHYQMEARPQLDMVVEHLTHWYLQVVEATPHICQQLISVGSQIPVQLAIARVVHMVGNSFGHVNNQCVESTCLCLR